MWSTRGRFLQNYSHKPPISD
uniref:Uncharacterized protein n=1 Tax=Anguilla anguilla TaxID=7936 RepID=A0A0E9XQ52_ANGAN